MKSYCHKMKRSVAIAYRRRERRRVDNKTRKLQRECVVFCVKFWFRLKQVIIELFRNKNRNYAADTNRTCWRKKCAHIHISTRARACEMLCESFSKNLTNWKQLLSLINVVTQSRSFRTVFFLVTPFTCLKYFISVSFTLLSVVIFLSISQFW